MANPIIVVNNSIQLESLEDGDYEVIPQPKMIIIRGSFIGYQQFPMKLRKVSPVK